MAKKRKEVGSESLTDILTRGLVAHFTFTCPYNSFYPFDVMGDCLVNNNICSGHLLYSDGSQLKVDRRSIIDNSLHIGNGNVIGVKQFTFQSQWDIVSFKIKEELYKTEHSELLVSLGTLKVYVTAEFNNETPTQYLDVYDSDSVIKKAVATIFDNNWHKVIIYKTDSLLKIYVDGQEIINELVELTESTDIIFGGFNNIKLNNAYLRDIRVYKLNENVNEEELIDRLKLTNEIIINSNCGVCCQELIETVDYEDGSPSGSEYSIKDNKLVCGWVEEKNGLTEVELHKNYISVKRIGEY